MASQYTVGVVGWYSVGVLDRVEVCKGVYAGGVYAGCCLVFHSSLMFLRHWQFQIFGNLLIF